MMGLHLYGETAQFVGAKNSAWDKRYKTQCAGCRHPIPLPNNGVK